MTTNKVASYTEFYTNAVAIEPTGDGEEGFARYRFKLQEDRVLCSETTMLPEHNTSMISAGITDGNQFP